MAKTKALARNCTDCKYGIRWGYLGSRSDVPIIPDDHITGRCRWRDLRTDIKFPQFFIEGVLFGPDSPPAGECEAWEQEPYPGWAPRWGELFGSWRQRMADAINQRVKAIEEEFEQSMRALDEQRRKRVQADPEGWRNLAAEWRANGHVKLAEDIERFLPGDDAEVPDAHQNRMV